MTWYADPSAPRLSDFQVDRRLTWEDFETFEIWPWGAAGSIRIVVGSIWNAEINRFENPTPEPALMYDQQWPDVMYGVNTASNWYMSHLLDQSHYPVGDTAARQQATLDLLWDRLEAMGINPQNVTVSNFEVEGISTVAHATGLGGRLAFADPGVDGREGDEYQTEYRALIWEGEVGASPVRADWQQRVADWLDDKIENNGWRFYKPWQTFPLVRPLMHHSNLGTGRSEGYAAGPDWYMGLDFWALVSNRIGDEVPWIKFTQMQDLRDPANPDYAITNWYPEVGFQSGMFPSRLYALVNGDTSGRGSYLFIESLDGQRPADTDEAAELCGVLNYIGGSVPGMISQAGSGGYFDWVGWKKKTGGSGEGDYEKPFRLYKVMALPEQLLGITSMEDLLAKENVSLAFTCELYPYSETGPASESTFEPSLFVAEPKGKVRLRMSVGDVWDGGGP